MDSRTICRTEYESRAGGLKDAVETAAASESSQKTGADAVIPTAFLPLLLRKRGLLILHSRLWSVSWLLVASGISIIIGVHRSARWRGLIVSLGRWRPIWPGIVVDRRGLLRIGRRDGVLETLGQSRFRAYLRSDLNSRNGP